MIFMNKLQLFLSTFNFSDTRTLNDSEKCSPIFSAFTLSETKFSLTWDSKSLIIQLLENNPVTPKEKLELYPPVDGISRVDIGR